MSVMTVTDSTFDAEVLQSKLPVLVEFTRQEKKKTGGTDDNASKKMDDILDALVDNYKDKVKFVRVEIKLDGDLKDSLNPVSSTKYYINLGPTLVFIKNGERAKDKDGAVIADVVGHHSKEQVVDWIGQMLT